MRTLILALLLTSCITPPAMEPRVEQLIDSKYKVDDCTYLVDPERDHKGNKKDAMKVVEVTSTHYVYRWWIHWTKNWAIGTNERTHSNYENITKPLEKCPDAPT